MSYIAILLGFACLVILCLKNVHTTLASFAAALVVTVLAGLPLTESLVTTFFGRFGSIAGSLLPMFLFGAILAKIYTNSGAASVIAETISCSLFHCAKTHKARYSLGLLSVILASAVLCYGGINAAVALIAIYPIAVSIFRRAGIPKRFIMGAICGGAFTFALSGPASPQPTNVVAMAIGTGPSCGLVAGIVASLTEIAVMVLILTKMCEKATAKGEAFVPGPKDVFHDMEENRPGFVIALLPLILLLIVFNVLKINVALAILISAGVSALLFYPQLGGEKLFQCLNDGASASLAPAVAIGAVNGFAAVVQSVPEYQILIDSMLASALPPVLLLVSCVAIICMMTGGSTTGTQIALPILAPTLSRMGLSLSFIHRVGTFSATMLDSLPNSGAVIMAVGLADLKMKEGYLPVFISTVVATTCGTVVVAVIMTLFPMLP